MKLKDNLMYRLLKIFSLTLIVIITLFSLIAAYVVNRDNHKQAVMLGENALNRLENYVTENQNKIKKLSTDLQTVETENQGITHYFSMNATEYLEYTLSHNYNLGYLPQVVQDAYLSDETIESLAIDYNLSQDKFYSSKELKNGKKVISYPESKGVKFSSVLRNQSTNELYGNVHITVDTTNLTNNLKQLENQFNNESFIIYNSSNISYTNTSDSALYNRMKNYIATGQKMADSDLTSDYYVYQKTFDSYQVLSLVSRKQVLRHSLSVLLELLLFSAIVDSVLLLLLFRLFNGYLYQVEDILASIKNVSNGERTKRICLVDKKAELRDISESINEMLESMDSFIRENYELELRQKEANFQALQAQINPHFMYNTLEYIRMYAVSEGMDELGEVVFSFASILRNNITQSKIITLENEMKFLEQYVYLYQMRYPKSVAYSFKLQEEVKLVEIPKFCLQPLVENYFAHGIDFTRTNNVISVTATKKDDRLKIEIRDNGNGISDKKLEQINRYLSEGHPYENQSIGIQNVNERMKIIFGDRYSMVFTHTDGGGTTIQIKLKLEE
ncbi:histidine kinase [Vagococcus sp. PNs007]|uniref:Histidine kinase n=1 Tax=Vagococcus proximus TaxID=2991417 RepID=A0ABT5X051_9ENTE|nr:histidine kinase [Vagococcus proximus]MDF0479386.1 histidine kinase [Vagococcus proximus]